MATATAEPYNGYGAARTSSFSVARSPDTASTVYPERAIRPLPKSRLKSKLSPQQQSAIVYPPDPPSISPALNFNVRENGHVSSETARGGDVIVNGDGMAHARAAQAARGRNSAIAVEHDHEQCTCEHDGIESGDEEVEFDHPDYRYATGIGALPMVAEAGGGGGKPLDSVQRRLMQAGGSRAGKPPPPPGSTASSADGYESFENTSNKKKRKIPLSSTSSVHQSTLSAEMARIEISGQGDAADDGAGGQQGWTQTGVPPVGSNGANSSAGGTGISGAGRGRYGRQNGRHDVRRPLSNSTMSAINGYSARLPSKVDGKAGDVGAEEKPGIITQAIESAAAQGPLTPQKGKENVSSLLQQQSSATTTPKTQFTFSCESDSSTRMIDAQQQAAAQAAAAGYGTPTPVSYARGSMNQAMPGPLPGSKPMSTQGTQTTPSLRSNNNPNPAARRPLPPNAPNGSQHPQQQQMQSPPKPKPRRRPSKEYAIAARQRKLQQDYQNYHQRPKPQDMWICEFCEYEDIFGVPPYAMIRKYEIKDRQERKKAAEKRRLLEKAKMKGRKGKGGKGAKGGKKGAGGGTNNGPATDPHNAPPPGTGHEGDLYDDDDPNLPPPGEDEYYDDEYDGEGDEYEPMGPEDGYPPAEYYSPPPAPAGTPVAGTPGIAGGGHHYRAGT